SEADRKFRLTMGIVTWYKGLTMVVVTEVGEEQDAEGAPGRAAVGDLALPVCAWAAVGGRGDGPVRRAAGAGADDGPDGDGAAAREGLPDADEAGGGFSLRAVCREGGGAPRPGTRVRREGAGRLGFAVLRLPGGRESPVGR